jgi:hypothetical protein
MKQTSISITDEEVVTIGANHTLQSTVDAVIGGVFTEDLAETQPSSSPSSPHFSLGLLEQFDMSYEGAFRATLDDAVSKSDYCTGTLGYNPVNHSIYMAGRDTHGSIAEFAIPASLSFETNRSSIPNATALQPWSKILQSEVADRVNGFLYHDGDLLVTCERKYDTTKTPRTLMRFDPDDIAAGYTMLQLQGKALSSGYMGVIPSNLQTLMGGDTHFSGWGDVYSINGRYSIGASIYSFNADDTVSAAEDTAIATTPHASFPHSEGATLRDNVPAGIAEGALWGDVSECRGAFIIPNTSILMIVGRHGGSHTGVGYKITQDNGNVCGGPCSYGAADNYNYFWLYDLNEVVAAGSYVDAVPFSFGKWKMPYGGFIHGAAFDGVDKLYICIGKAGQVGTYDRPPLILRYRITKKAV